jgi:TRAP-type C4-dicarboxylate transport system permease small subunit
MKVYADRPARRAVQLVADLFALGLTASAIWLAVRVHTEVMRMRAPGDGLVDAGSGLRGTFDSAAGKAGGIPLIGDALAGALHTGSAAGTKLVDAGTVPFVTDPTTATAETGSCKRIGCSPYPPTSGRISNWQIDAVANLAWWMAAFVVALPVVFLLVSWLPLRWRFTRGATAAARLRRQGEDGLDLLALRALVTRPLPRVAKAGELTSGWREHDPAVIRRLAGWELRRHGLRGVAG